MHVYIYLFIYLLFFPINAIGIYLLISVYLESSDVKFLESFEVFFSFPNPCITITRKREAFHAARFTLRIYCGSREPSISIYL